MSEELSDMPRTLWKIRVAGYGTFDFEGTEAEAEEMRIHKANWEQGPAIKWRTDLGNESPVLGLWAL